MAHVTIPADKTVLIAGPTASGKSALALQIAREGGGVVVNADALQVFSGWPILTAQPSAADQAAAPHVLYGHLPHDQATSVGHWLRDVTALPETPRRIIVGGTGLYFAALTVGLVDIPATPDVVRTQADTLSLRALLADLDPTTCARIDTANRARVQRAWEVQRSTGRSIVDWQNATPPPLMPLESVIPILLDAPKDWLTPRIALRFDQMLAAGVLDEARAMWPYWDPADPASKAIGATALMAHLQGDLSLDAAREAIIVATRQYAKRQRTFFNKRMASWHRIDMTAPDPFAAIAIATG